MDIIAEIVATALAQVQKPTLAFLIGAGISVRAAEFTELGRAGAACRCCGGRHCSVGAGHAGPVGGVSHSDGLATVGLFGAVSASTLAAGMAVLDDEGIAYEGFIGAQGHGCAGRRDDHGRRRPIGC